RFAFAGSLPTVRIWFAFGAHPDVAGVSGNEHRSRAEIGHAGPFAQHAFRSLADLRRKACGSDGPGGPDADLEPSCRFGVLRARWNLAEGRPAGGVCAACAGGTPVRCS